MTAPASGRGPLDRTAPSTAGVDGAGSVVSSGGALLAEADGVTLGRVVSIQSPATASGPPIAFAAPDEARYAFGFACGQYLTLKATIDTNKDYQPQKRQDPNPP